MTIAQIQCIINLIIIGAVSLLDNSFAKGELQVKSKKLLIALTVVAVVVVIIVVLATVLTIQNVVPVYHGFDGAQISGSDDGVVPEDILNECKGKSIVFLSKTNLMSTVNEKFTEWHAFAVVKHFPNVVEIHFIRRTAVAKFISAGAYIYIDCFGYPTQKPEEDKVIDISSAFNATDLRVNTPGQAVEFQSDESNARLSYVLGAIEATWQCMVEVSEMKQVLDEQSAFSFDADGNLVIQPKLKGKIVVQSPDVDLSMRLIKAYSVYYNDKVNLQDDDYTITVYKNGRITTPSK